MIKFKIMNPVYDSRILKWKNVHWSKNQHELAEVIKECHGAQVLARVRQFGKVVEIANLNGNLCNQLKLKKVDLGLAFDLEVITRTPHKMGGNGASSNRSGVDNYLDRNDQNSLQWNGERGVGNIVKNRLRNTPMFFRSNGMSVDLIDLYAGQTLFLILNGSSLNGFDWAKLKRPGVCTFGVNNGAHAFRPNFWACVDDPTRFMKSIWTDPTVTKFVPMAHFEKPIWDKDKNAIAESKVKDFPNVYGYRRNEAFKADQWLFEDTINWGNHSKLGGGRSVMLATLRIAFLLGFRKVCLVGCDFYMDDNKRYWFAEDRTKSAISNNQNSYRILSGFFEELQPHFLASGFQVVNCNPSSQLKVFPLCDLDAELSAAEVDNSDSTIGMYVDRYKASKPSPASPPAAQASKLSVTTRKVDKNKPVDIAIIDHLTRAFKAAKLSKDPFDHVILQSAFEDTLNEQLINNLPDNNQYHDLQHADAMRPDGTSTRLRFGFSIREIGLLPAKKRVFWSLVRKALQSKRLEATIREVFEEALFKRFGEKHKMVEFRPQVELLRDLHGYKIGIHTDIPVKAITVQFYLTNDNKHEFWGTSYFSRGNDGTYTQVNHLAFRPGYGHAFVVNDRSFHGVDVAIGSGEARNSLMLTYYLKNG